VERYNFVVISDDELKEASPENPPPLQIDDVGGFRFEIRIVAGQLMLDPWPIAVDQPEISPELQLSRGMNMMSGTFLEVGGGLPDAPR
jgi:hypothetical protein